MPSTYDARQLRADLSSFAPHLGKVVDVDVLVPYQGLAPRTYF